MEFGDCPPNFPIAGNKHFKLPFYFDLRHEAQQSWHHFQTDKLVYVSQVLDRQLYVSLFIPEQDFNIWPWMEPHLVFRRERQCHYCLIADFPFRDRNSASHFKKNAGIRRMKPNDPVLVRIPKEIEPPEMVGLVRLPTVIRLKRLDEVNCLAGNAFGGELDLSLCIRCIFDAHGKADIAGSFFGSDFGQVPGDMVKRAPQVADKVASHQTNIQHMDCAYRLNLDGEQPPFRILICGDSIKLFGLVDERGIPSIESVQMNLRPLHHKVALFGYHN